MRWLEEQIKLLDYYFFGIGMVSLISAFFLALKTLNPYYVLVVFYFVSFTISFLLNLVLIKRMKSVYVWSARNYITSHAIMAIVTSAITVLAMLVIGETLMFVLYFIIINFALMIAMLVILYIEYRHTRMKLPFKL